MKSLFYRAGSVSNGKPNWRWWALIVAIAVVYIVTARLGLLLALPPEKKASAVWPPSGIALAALLLLGYRLWPGIWLGAFLSNFWDFFDPANPFPLLANLFVSFGIATGSTLQALAGNYLLRRSMGSESPFDRASHAFAYAGVAISVCLIAATIGAASLYVGGFAPAQDIGFIWWTWWLGNLTGVLTVGSFILAWSCLPIGVWKIRRWLEAISLLGLIIILGSVVFGLISLSETRPPPLAYLTLPFLVWATFRFGRHGATTTLCVVSVLAVLGTAQGTVPFAQPTIQASMLLVQVFIGVIAVMALVMTAVLSESQGAEDKLHRWEYISDRAGWPVVIVDPDGSILKGVNLAFADMLGYTVEELVGMPQADTIAPEYRSEFFRQIQAAQEKVDHVYESVLVRKDGSHFPCLTHATTFKDANGKVQYRAATFQDTTEIKQAESVLRASERRYRALVEATPQVVWSVGGNDDAAMNWWSEVTGQTTDELAGLGWLDAVHPDDRERVQAVWAEAYRTLVIYDTEYRIRTRTGEFRHFAVRGAPLPDLQGRIVEWIGTLADITEKKRAEKNLLDLNATLEQRVEERTQALREHEERFRSAFDHAPIGMALVSPNGKWLRVNTALCEIVGYSESEILLADFQTITHPDDLQADLGHVREMLAGTIRTYQMEKRYIHKEGHIVNILLSVSLVRDGAGAPLYFISQIKDITQRKQAEERILASLREKEVLLKEIHHRVKNNLQIVSTLLDLQSDHTKDRQALEMFQESRSRVKSMALIHERLYHSQDLARVDFAQYVRQLAEDLFQSYKLSDDDIVLDLNVDVPALPIDIAIPCGLLLNELMSNCLKHGFKNATTGCIRVSLRTGDDRSNVLIVADNGAGFPPDIDFRKTESFGMQLVNTLVEQLNGTIELKNHCGTEITVRF